MPRCVGLRANWSALVKSESASRRNSTVITVRNHPRRAVSFAMRGTLIACANRFKRRKRNGRSVEAPAVVEVASALQEFPDGADECFLLLVHHHVAGILDQLELAVLD